MPRSPYMTRLTACLIQLNRAITAYCYQYGINQCYDLFVLTRNNNNFIPTQPKVSLMCANALSIMDSSGYNLKVFSHRPPKALTDLLLLIVQSYVDSCSFIRARSNA